MAPGRVRCEHSSSGQCYECQSQVDWVRVLYLVAGRSLPGEEEPTHMELMVAARTLRPQARRGRPAGQPVGVHTEMGVTYQRFEAARAWMRRHKVPIPTLQEAFAETYREE